MRGRRLTAILTIPALAAGMVFASPVAAQEAQSGTPSVDVRPVGTSPNDPNQGQWFVASLSGGADTRFTAEIVNPADVEQTVRLYVTDMDFARGGAASLAEVPTGVGTWASLERSTVTIGPQDRTTVQFTVTAPDDAPPGDHVGAFVAEHEPEGTGDIRSIRRVAVRMYLTIPGDAPRDLAIETVKVERDSWFYPREATILVTLRNTGRVRLQPTVKINDAEAAGPEIIMSRSIEPYLSTESVPFWGGFLRYRVDVTSRAGDFAGPARQMRVSTFVIPWHLLVLLLVTAGLVYGGRVLWRKRGSKYTALQQDIRRIERLLAAQAAGGGRAPVEEDDPEVAILSAMKQARRSGDKDTEARLQEKLDASRALKNGPPPEDGAPPDALTGILKELANAPPERHGALIAAARAFGPQALRQHRELILSLPTDVRVRLIARKRGSKPKQAGKDPNRRP